MMRVLLVIAAAVAACACSELPQEGPKSFVPGAERQAAGNLDQRAHTQDEYLRVRKQ